MFDLGRLNEDITRALTPQLSEEEQQKLAEKKEILFCELAKESLLPTKGLDKILEYIKQNRSKLKIGTGNRLELKSIGIVRLRFGDQCSSFTC